MRRAAKLAWALLLLAACGAGGDDEAAEVPRVSSRQQALALHRAALTRDLARDRGNTKRVQLAKGIRSVRIESGFRHVSVAMRDGGAHDCVDQLPEAVR